MNSEQINQLIMSHENLREEVLYHAEKGNMIQLVASFSEMNVAIIKDLLDYYNMALEKENGETF